ncbi:hypothetical protein FRC03_012356, partial [Tulasnella sp. 419]
LLIRQRVVIITIHCDPLFFFFLTRVNRKPYYRSFPRIILAASEFNTLFVRFHEFGSAPCPFSPDPL